MRVLFIADIMGKPGRWAVATLLPSLKKKYEVDFCIANIENAAGGFGITKEIAHKIHSYGVDCLTSGNHIWDRREIADYLASNNKILRPANYSPLSPGTGSNIFLTRDNKSLGVINLQGRVFMSDTDCPFRIAKEEVAKLKAETKIIIVDFHAEATSEKMAMGWHLDGKVSAVIGTHTHVQTADETILPEGTAYITDAGMTGPYSGIIGIKKEDALSKFLTGMPVRFGVADEDVKFCGVLLEIDSQSGKALTIERLRIDLQKSESGFDEKNENG